MEVFSKDRCNIKDGVGYVFFDEAGDLTQVRVKETLDQLAVRFCRKVYVVIGDGVTKIGDNAFRNRLNLYSVYISNSVTTIGKFAFHFCQNLVEIELSDNITEIAEGTFLGCKSIKAIYIPEKVSYIDRTAFNFCQGLETIIVDRYNKAYKAIGGNLYTRDKKMLVLYATGKKDISFAVPDGVEKINDFAFFRGGNLKEILLPPGLLSIGASAFSDCRDLECIELPEGVEEIGMGAFSMCGKLASIRVPASVTAIGNGAFSSCELLECVIIDEGNKSYKTIDGSLYTKDGKTFVQYFGKKTSFLIPEGVQTIGGGAFYCCKNLVSVKIPKGVITIGKEAFSKCEALERIELPKGVTSVGEMAFCDCESLEYITIPKSVVNMGKHQFSYCCLLEIHAEAKAEPTTWDKEWNCFDRPVIWGYKID